MTLHEITVNNKQS